MTDSETVAVVVAVAILECGRVRRLLAEESEEVLAMDLRKVYFRTPTITIVSTPLQMIFLSKYPYINRGYFSKMEGFFHLLFKTSGTNIFGIFCHCKLEH